MFKQSRRVDRPGHIIVSNISVFNALSIGSGLVVAALLYIKRGKFVLSRIKIILQVSNTRDKGACTVQTPTFFRADRIEDFIVHCIFL